MSFWDDLSNFANDLVHGNVGGAVHDVGQGIHDALGGSASSGSDVGVGSMMSSRQAADSPKAVAAAQAAAARGMQGAASTASCCDRYKLDSGFLVDGVTGTVWQFDPKTKSFEEIPVNHAQPKQTLIDTVVENRLSAFKSRYESEFLNTVPPAQRPQLLATFDTQHLAPLRDVAKKLLY
jgi:hypothetical protein